ILAGLSDLPYYHSACLALKANGEVKYDTATFTSPASKFGNSNGTLVPEGVASEGMQGTGSWERSAISARFFLKCQLKTCGCFVRTIYQEIFPWQAYSNQDGYLVPSNPPPPPPASSEPAESRTTNMHSDGGLAHQTSRAAPPTPASVFADRLPGIWGAGQEQQLSGLPDRSEVDTQAPPLSGAHADFSAPVQNAIRTAAANLSVAISFAQDMEQSMPQNTHRSLALSLRTTSDILREVSEELLNAARNEAISSAQGSEADDQQMAQAD
ncbi:tag-125, partial [Symbiodinium necroappetens]